MAALLVPTSLGLLLPAFPIGRRRRRCGGVAAATGPSLGGVLIAWGDWRLFLTGARGWSALHAGVAVTPGPLMAALSSALAGRVVDRYGPRVAAVPGGVVFALGCTLFAVGLGASPAYGSEFLRASLWTGCGVGLSFAGFSSAAVLGLPAARLSTRSAVANCFRRLGAVLGISVLIAVVDGAPVLADFTRAYRLMAACGLTAG